MLICHLSSHRQALELVKILETVWSSVSSTAFISQVKLLKVEKGKASKGDMMKKNDSNPAAQRVKVQRNRILLSSQLI